MRPRTGEHMAFVGVSTTRSSIMRVFPVWAGILGLPTGTLVGIDLPVGAPAAAYIDVVRRIRDDPTCRGALVTTHKVALYEATAGEFAALDEFAALCGEISTIAKRGDRLVGEAKDPLTARLALEEFLPGDHFRRTGADAVVLGAGGAGTALTWCLAERADRPASIVVTDTDPARLRRVRDIHERRGSPSGLLRYVVASDPETSGAVLAAAAPGSLVVNATGLGKDRPGSPLPTGATFPRRAHVWEFNYRGDLEFLDVARRQERERDLRVHDGWRYFIHGWSQAIAAVFGVPIDDDRLVALAEAAGSARG